MHVLVVEDEPKMAALIKRVLVAERHVVDLAPDGVSAVALATQAGPRRHRPRPDAAGHRRHHGAPAPSREGDRDAGPDAHRARIRGRPGRRPRRRGRRLPREAVRVLRAARADPGTRPAPRDPADARLAAGDLVLDELRHVAEVGDQSVDLSAREFALLGFFIRHSGQVVTRQQILDEVWGAEPNVYSNVVDLYVSYLRRKLGELDRASRLRTVRGVGYTLRAEG